MFFEFCFLLEVELREIFDFEFIVLLLVGLGLFLFGVNYVVINLLYNLDF